MNKKIMVFGFIVLLAGISVFAQSSKSLSPENVKIHWKGYKVTGEHEGFISLKSGNLMFDKDVLTGGMIEVDMNSITCTDIEDKEYNGKLVGHLKSDDFFGVKTFPVAVMNFKEVKKTKSGYMVTADVTIKKATHPVKFEVEEMMKDGKKMLKSKIVIDRSKYDVRYGSSSFFDSLGDKVIYDDFELYVNVSL